MLYYNDPNPDFVIMRPVDCHCQAFYMYSVSGNERFDFSKEKKEVFDKIVHLFAMSAMLFKGQPLYGAYKYHFLKGDLLIEEITKEIIPTSKRANRLIAYLKTLRDEDIFFILSADLPTQDRMCAHLAVKAIASGCSVIESVAHYKQTWGVVNNKYRYLSFGRDGVEESIGESDKDLRVCRFCGKKKPETSFKKIAHAISEGLGNKILVCNEECDKCNNRLARVEENLMHYFDIKRALSGIKTKTGNKVPAVDGKGFVIRGNEKNEPVLYLEEEFVEEEKKQGNPLYLKLETDEVVSFEGIYKALCKIVLDLIPSDELSHFKETVRWINGEIIATNHPSYYMQSNRAIYEQPVIDIYLSKNLGTEPYCTALLFVLDTVFLFVVPETDVDNVRYMRDGVLVNHFDQFMPLVKGQEWLRIDSNDYRLSYPWIKREIDLSDPNVRVRPATDPIFTRYDKTKNYLPSFAFPEFSEEGIEGPKFEHFQYDKYSDIDPTEPNLRHTSFAVYKQCITVDYLDSRLLFSGLYRFVDETRGKDYFSVEFETCYTLKDFYKYIVVKLDGGENQFALHRELRTYVIRQAMALVDAELKKHTLGTGFAKITLSEGVVDERVMRKTRYLIPAGNGQCWTINDAKLNPL